MDTKMTTRLWRAMLVSAREYEEAMAADHYNAVRFVEGDMGSDERADFEARISSEPELAAIVSEMRELFSTPCMEPSEEELSSFFDDAKRRVLQRLSGQTATTSTTE